MNDLLDRYSAMSNFKAIRRIQIKSYFLPYYSIYFGLRINSHTADVHLPLKKKCVSRCMSSFASWEGNFRVNLIQNEWDKIICFIFIWWWNSWSFWSIVEYLLITLIFTTSCLQEYFKDKIGLEVNHLGWMALALKGSLNTQNSQIFRDVI